ncbi:MAG: hypothetical protein ACOC3V_03540 [bacterium]
MKFNSILNEKRINISGATRTGKKYVQYRGIHGIILDESEPPDVHGIPKDLEAYGRGGFYPNGQIFIDGGPQGSHQGHPNNIENGFYWGADYDALWGKHKGVFYLRGRAGTKLENILDNKLLTQILELIFKRLPKR